MKLSEIKTSLKDLIGQFINDFSGPRGQIEWGATLNVLHDEAGNCAMISETLAKWLKANGVKARTVSGYIAKNRDWDNVMSDPDEDAHTVVRVSDEVVDLNARQFGKNMPYPRIIPFSEFLNEWESVSN